MHASILLILANIEVVLKSWAWLWFLDLFGLVIFIHHFIKVNWFNGGASGLLLFNIGIGLFVDLQLGRWSKNGVDFREWVLSIHNFLSFRIIYHLEIHWRRSEYLWRDLFRLISQAWEELLLMVELSARMLDKQAVFVFWELLKFEIVSIDFLILPIHMFLMNCHFVGCFYQICKSAILGINVALLFNRWLVVSLELWDRWGLRGVFILLLVIDIIHHWWYAFEIGDPEIIWESFIALLPLLRGVEVASGHIVAGLIRAHLKTAVFIR